MKDPKMDELIEKANHGDVQAQCFLGDSYEDEDNVKSAYWFKKAADQHYLDGIYNLADYYLEGKGVEKDEKKAFELYLECTKFINSNYPYDKELAYCACIDIAQFYKEGNIVEKDIPTAMEWMAKAGEGNYLHSDEAEELAEFYEDNQYGQQDFNKAIHWYKKAYNYSKIIALCKSKLGDDVMSNFYLIKGQKRHHCYYGFLADRNIDYNQIDNQYYTYYKTQFAKNIQQYYKLQKSDQYPQITYSLSCHSQSRDEEYLKLDQMVEYHFFSIATYFTSLFPQVLGKIMGKECANQFFLASGWPCLYCGMGGWMSPIDIINDSDLRPTEADIEDYLFIFKKVTNLMINEFIQFIRGGQSNLNATAYESMVNQIKGQTASFSQIETECEYQCEMFKNWINNPMLPYESYLVAQKES